MSKLIYLMPLWSGCEDYLVRSLQVVQNKAARTVARLSIFTPTKTLMKACGWMSVRQLMAYHSLVLLHKILQQKSPSYLYQKVTSGTQQYNTRQAADTTAALAEVGITLQPSVDICELELSRSSWCWASVKWYRQLPPGLQAEKKLSKFKTALKSWVTKNIDSS